MAGFGLHPCPLLHFSASGKIRSIRFLSGYYPTPELGIPTLPIDGYERVPTLFAMANVYVNSNGYVWNEKVRGSKLNDKLVGYGIGNTKCRTLQHRTAHIQYTHDAKNAEVW